MKIIIPALFAILGLCDGRGRFPVQGIFALSRNATFRKEHQKLFAQFYKDEAHRFGTPFKPSCSPMGPSPSTPSTVHKLRPADIKVVAAMGDSITAADGANAYTIIGVLTQFRGVSWSIGGDSSAETLPNFLKQYNPYLIGASKGNGPRTAAASALNVARPGATANDMVKQAHMLVRRLKDHKNIDFHNDWKLVTLFIGGNDLCDSCKNVEKYSPKNFVRQIDDALEILHREVPRVFVNLVDVINVSMAQDLHEGNSVCRNVHRYLCSCGAFPENDVKQNEFNERFRAYSNGLSELAGKCKYCKNDFTVVLQPFSRQTTTPYIQSGGKMRPDLSYFAPDCFHYSGKGHGVAARSLWNNMLEPVGNKSTSLDLGGKVNCPSDAHPFFFTAENSIKS